MSPARKAPSSRKKAPSPQKRGGSSKRRPKGSPELREAFERDLSRVEELDALYRPLREAGEAQLAKTKSGRKMLEETRAFGTELAELYENIISGRTQYEEGHRLARRRHEEFRERYEDQLRDTYAAHLRLRPSVEAVAQVLRPEMSPKTIWLSETGLLGSMLLEPKPVPEGGERAYPTQAMVPADTIAPADTGTVSQGLGDPTPPQAVQSCVSPPYMRKQDYAYTGPLTEVGTGVDLERGQVGISGTAVATAFFHGQGTIASAYVGQDFDVPEGIASYMTTVSYDQDFYGWGFALFGVAIVNLNVAIGIDKGDGTPREDSSHSVSLLTVPVAAYDSFRRSSSVKVTLPFTRTGSSTPVNPPSGTVKVWVGVDGHCALAAFVGAGGFWGGLKVREICVNSAV
jgi:hypothetical protein